MQKMQKMQEMQKMQKMQKMQYYLVDIEGERWRDRGANGIKIIPVTEDPEASEEFVTPITIPDKYSSGKHFLIVYLTYDGAQIITELNILPETKDCPWDLLKSILFAISDMSNGDDSDEDISEVARSVSIPPNVYRTFAIAMCDGEIRAYWDGY
jgi:hypothetical protein